MKIRKATEKDIPDIILLIKELAVYENAPEKVEITAEQLKEDGFGTAPLFWVLLAEDNDDIFAMSFYYIRYSTWKGKCLYLEDIVVKKDFRNKGIGKELLDATIQEAKEMNAQLTCWQVLDWNKNAIDFYKKYGAEIDKGWYNCTILKKQIEEINLQ